MNQPLLPGSPETFTNSLMLQLSMHGDFQAETTFAIRSTADSFSCQASPLAVTTSSIDAVFGETLDQSLQHSYLDTRSKALSKNTENDRVTRAAMEPARLLRLPLEVRQLIYRELLDDTSLLKMRLNQRAPWFQLGRDTSFLPSEAAGAAHGILLTCRQCYDEGITLYYRWAKVSDFGHLDRWCLQKPPAYHAQRHTQDCSYADTQCFPTYVHTKFVLPHVTSNLSMIMKYSRDFVETGTSWLSNFRFAQSARQVTIKLPGRDFVQDMSQLANAVPSDEQLVAQHARYLPSRENGYFLKYVRRSWVVPDRHKDNEEGVIEKLITQSRIEFIARFPILYSVHGQDNWEICEYNLKSQRLIRRFETSEETVFLEDYPESLTSLDRIEHY